MTENERRERAKLAEMPRCYTRGRWAVAVVGLKGWMQDMALGDDITSALYALWTRCETREEAEALAARLNDAEPGVLPGSLSVPVYAAVPYRRADYIGSQNRSRNQCRNCDRRIWSR